MVYTDLVIDQDVRDWVLIPLTVSITLMKLVMQYVHQMIGNAPPPSKDTKSVKEVQAVARSGKLRYAGPWIPEPGFKMRKNFYIGKDTGVFVQVVQSNTQMGMNMAATDPTVMADMMKRQLVGIVFQFGVGAWVTSFFGGFVMAQLPFSMSPRFKPLTQRGVELASLDTSYITSLSFYMMLLYGLGGLFSLVFREDAVDDTEMMRRAMNPMPQPGFDPKTAFEAEKNALTLVDHDWALEESENRAMQVLQAMLEGKTTSKAGPSRKKQN